MSLHNLAVKLCGVLQTQSEEDVTAREWRLVGQEQDGWQLFTWISTGRNNQNLFHIGSYLNRTKTLTILHRFEEKLNIIQASVNSSHTLLAYVVKLITDDNETKYTAFLLPLATNKEKRSIEISSSASKQMMVQFVYGKSNKYVAGVKNDSLIVFKHLECINLYKINLISEEQDNGFEFWNLDESLPEPDQIVKVFTWAQWDCVNQVLFYIYYRQPVQSFAEGDETKSPTELTQTLSALQFHPNLPHETVLNIPLNLPHLDSSSCGEYADDPVPLRIHDCGLDLQIVSDANGVVCICHHYLYKPLDSSSSSIVDSIELRESGVNFAYSITLLHHGIVVHNVVADLEWHLAKTLRPSYCLYGDKQLLVSIPKLLTQIIDISPAHKPSNHIVMANTNQNGALAPLIGYGNYANVDLSTLDIVVMNVQDKDLVSTFKCSELDNKLAILHYLVMHEGNFDLADELISWSCLNQRSDLNSFHHLMQEYLISSTYAITKRALPASAEHFMDMLPYMAHLKFTDVQINQRTVSVSCEQLWQSAAVVLAPRQRLRPFAEDQWTKLWTKLNRETVERFSQHSVREKLTVSLHCYQPEALSRCSTPHSPVAPVFPQKRTCDLPFHEVDLCTASKQEHVAAANLRCVSLHAMRSGVLSLEGGAQAVSTRWVCSQLEASRALCKAICDACAATVMPHQQRGLAFIDEMDSTHACVLFKVLEQYYLAADSMAFPLPQGFTSFFTYLGYKTMPFYKFTQYVHRNVFELQIDVLKHIVSNEEDTPDRVKQKLRLVGVSGHGRAFRVLNAWSAPPALTLRALAHAHALLTGGTRTHQLHRYHKPAHGVAALPSGARLPCLDTFLDLLTAKASLNELDFNLIIEATLMSLQDDE